MSSASNSQIDLIPPSSHASTNTGFISCDKPFDLGPDEDLSFPAYGRSSTAFPEDLEPPESPLSENSYTVPSPPSDSTTPTNTPEASLNVVDDTAVRPEPSRHVDYLSHDWREEDIWSSWRYIVSKRWHYGERSREENASWRTWAKQKYKLRTVPPDTLNWYVFTRLTHVQIREWLTSSRLKDCDVTWLYGPLQTATYYSVSQPTSEPPSNLSKNNSFLTKKPILKKRSASEVMLQKSLSASSLVRQAAAAIEAQQSMYSRGGRSRPFLGRSSSDSIDRGMSSQSASRDQVDYLSSYSTSGLQTPIYGEKKHIRFDDKVEQCIAVEVKEGDFDDEDDSAVLDTDSSSDEDVVMMKRSKQRKPISRSSSRSSFSGESKTIAMLPSTTLKYRTDSPDVPELPSHSIRLRSGWRPGRLSPSPSQETLRPVDPSKNFLLEDDDDDDDENDISWDPSRAFPDRRDSAIMTISTENEANKHAEGLRRTPSGMFMPYDDDENGMISGGILGKMVDTVNTAKDIAHVIWNVGWRK